MLNHADAVKGGGHAVSIFFVLSGFLIGGQLVCEKRRTGTIQLPEFFFKRVTRIWLPYFIVLAFYIALFFARGQNSIPGFYERMFGALTYTYNWYNDIRCNNVPTNPAWASANQIWSLSVEEQFYLVVPLLISWIPGRSVAPVSLILTLLFTLFFPPYAGLFLGVLLAAAQNWAVLKSLSLQFNLLLSTAFVVSFGLLFVVGQTNISQYSWITYLLSGVVVLLANGIRLPPWTHNGLRYLGLMTYSYYLIHLLPGYFLGAIYRRITTAPHNPVWLNIVSGLLALPLSFQFVRWIELPALKIRGEMLNAGSPWIRSAPWLAWGLNIAGLIGLICFGLH